MKPRIRKKAKLRAPAPTEETHTRFLDSAERLFSVHGYEGTKIRAIAKLSSANLGVLSHYWGSKRALFREVFERRLRPIQEERMRRFGILKAMMADGRAIRVADVLEAEIEPAFLIAGSDPQDAAQRRLLFGRALMDPSGEVVEIMSEIFHESAMTFFSLLRHVSPHVDQSEFYWRAQCVAGAFSFAESFTERLTQFIEEDLSQIDWQAASAFVVRFLVAGMAAPPAPKSGKSRLRQAPPRRRRVART
jgi:AcrR family transcriptional regulator